MLRADSWQRRRRTATPTCATPTCPTSTPGAGWPSWPGPTPTTRRCAQRYDVMEYPVGISYFAWGAAWVTHWADRLTRHRAERPGRAGRRPGRHRTRSKRESAGSSSSTRWASRGWRCCRRGSWPGSIRGGRGTRPPFAAVTGAGADRADQLGPARGGAGRRRALGLGAGPAGAHRRPDRARHRHQALPAVPARRVAGHLPARAAAGATSSRAARRGVAAWLRGQRCRRTSAAPRSGGVFWEFNADRGPDLGSIWLVSPGR